MNKYKYKETASGILYYKLQNKRMRAALNDTRINLSGDVKSEYQKNIQENTDIIFKLTKQHIFNDLYKSDTDICGSAVVKLCKNLLSGLKNHKLNGNFTFKKATFLKKYPTPTDISSYNNLQTIFVETFLSDDIITTLKLKYQHILNISINKEERFLEIAGLYPHILIYKLHFSKLITLCERLIETTKLDITQEECNIIQSELDYLLYAKSKYKAKQPTFYDYVLFDKEILERHKKQIKELSDSNIIEINSINIYWNTQLTTAHAYTTNFDDLIIYSKTVALTDPERANRIIEFAYKREEINKNIKKLIDRVLVSINAIENRAMYDIMPKKYFYSVTYERLEIIVDLFKKLNKIKK